MNLPQDNFMLLSLANTKLRDECENLEELCSLWDCEEEVILSRLSSIGYAYFEEENAFKPL